MEFASYIVADLQESVLQLFNSTIVAPCDEGERFLAKSFSIHSKGEK